MLRDQDPRANPDSVSYLKMQSVLRMVILKVMYENNIDVFVNPEQTTPPYKLGGPGEPEINDRPTISCCTAFTALLGGPEMDIPAGYTRIVYDQTYALTPDKKDYVEVTGEVESQLPYPMPISMMFWAGPGSDSAVIKAASAYEAATHHRVPPPAFGPLPASVSRLRDKWRRVRGAAKTIHTLIALPASWQGTFSLREKDSPETILKG
jgi:Asp-tRNA(Asn)/Glu-tRNA(Gln) amidotransferase A subunit family amidase